jgi:ABC-type Fe3+-hydroxamate transport system substrate-binding protein
MMKLLSFEDDRGKAIRLAAPPKRIVSLVPSDTYTLLRLGAGERLVGRTRYCVEPAEQVKAIADVGGTKDPDLDAVLALSPDIVVMNQEENTRRDVERLEAAGAKVFVTFPKRLASGAALVARLARLFGDIDPAAKELVRFAYDALARAEARLHEPRIRAFVPIWNQPLMTINGDTFISDVLLHAGADNVFADRDRRYPLAADIGRARPASPEEVAGRDVRYPRVTMDEVVERAPDIVLLPDEPHAFTEEEAEAFRALDIPAGKNGRVVFATGKHLMWPGLMSLEGLDHVAAMMRGAS